MEHHPISIIFPNGREQQYEKGITAMQVAQSVSSTVKKNSVVAKVNDELVDMNMPIEQSSTIRFFDIHSLEGLQVMRHSAAHVLAQAVKNLYNNVNFGVGPVIEHGFYYDIDVSEPISVDHLEHIEKEMKRIINSNYVIKREEISYELALELFAEDPLKLELLRDIPSEEVISVYRQDDYIDLCRGPHLPSTGYIKSFKLTSVSGAYWRGNSDNQMLQRIYGVAFESNQKMKDYFHQMEEAHKRNHRKLGQELELFMFSEEAPGMPFYLANGQIIRNELEAFLRQLQHLYDYQEVRTPLMMNKRLWERSGHWDHYKDNMYFTEVDQQEFALKPMNCPGHMLIFKEKLRSYRDLPIRMAEFGQVHRHEFSGALNGLLRVRTFCQDDAHIFVRKDQIEQEIALTLKLIKHMYDVFGFEFTIEVSTRPDKYMGSDEVWDYAESALMNVLDDLNFAYSINAGDGAFYGPKIDIHIKDAIARSHQCATVQLDFQMPEKFELSYVDEHNDKQRPVVIHRAVFGSIDRFLGILIEHYGGVFPLWLAPVQVKIVAVSNSIHMAYADKVYDQFRQAGIRIELDTREEKLGYKIRDAQLKKIPYIIVVGDEEMLQKSVNVRQYGGKKSSSYSVESFLQMLQSEIVSKALNPQID
ncbi:MAG: threonine--tRNA ligase [Candidatus Pristimantibacillus lignocellulolyticus]|uniref:Threonine--tRNA ligase n=1 Tax=Candidatus Pristimantibacillus lignocellulolyticus TaxID=2994561 RepID=A0A9J6Z8X1_9BACL|nr:MAG: threonine--tRNA ligase [Candidatus Pristimantibacillus lignocellulolyticus]